jgi:small-conductance mechanosensitive channel
MVMTRFMRYTTRLGHVAALAVAVLALLPAAARGADSNVEGVMEGEVASRASVAVLLDGRVLIRVRGFSGYTAAERARAIQDRIIEFASDRNAPVDTLSLAEARRGSEIRAGSVVILTVTDADAAVEDLSRPVLADATLQVLKRSVETWREQRSLRVLLRHGGYALAATIALSVVVWLLFQGFRHLRALMRLQAGARVKAVKFGAFEVIRAEHLRGAVQGAVRLLFWFVLLWAIYLYLEFVLPLFPWTRPIGERLLQLVIDPLTTLGLSFVGALPNLAFLVVLFFVVRYLLKLGRMFFLAIEHNSLHFESFDAEWAMPTYKMLRIFVVAFAVVVAYPYIPGSDSAAFKGVSVLLGVIFSLGSSSVIGNIIAGYTMTYRRAFRKGDRIKVGEVCGDVVDSTVLVTTLRTPKNELVVVPNSEILSKSIVNYSALARKQGLLLYTTVGIGYETPWRQVEAMLVMAADRTEGLLRDPPPFVLQTGLGDFCVTYELNAATADASSMARQYSALHANILDVFNEYGVQIMTPNYEADTPDAKLVRKDDWYAAPARPPAEPSATPTG